MESVQKHLYVLILAGGGGTRLWPQSRESMPKQFSRLFDGKSLFELTLARAKKLAQPSHIYISTSAKYASHIRKLASGVPSENILGEPFRRDTAMAHGLGALYIYKLDPDAVIVNLASDHLIDPVSAFAAQAKLAAKLAFTHNQLVTIGIRPKYPHSGMGHIKAKKNIANQPSYVLLGEKFVEKPELAIAKKYTDSGDYLWNANLYVYKAKYFLDLLKVHSPKTYAMYPKILASIGTDKENSTISLAFQMAPSISIDYAISEKLHKFICIRADFNWTDVGDWNEVWKNLPKDVVGNAISGPSGQARYIGVDSKNNLLFLDKKLIATAGLQDMIVVDTPDALLICPKGDSQAVKKIVQIMKDQKLDEYL